MVILLVEMATTYELGRILCKFLVYLFWVLHNFVKVTVVATAVHRHDQISASKGPRAHQVTVSYSKFSTGKGKGYTGLE